MPDVDPPPCTGCSSWLCEDCFGPLGGRLTTAVPHEGTGLPAVLAGAVIGVVLAVVVVAVVGLTVWTFLAGWALACVCAVSAGAVVSRKARR